MQDIVQIFNRAVKTTPEWALGQITMVRTECETKVYSTNKDGDRQDVFYATGIVALAEAMNCNCMLKKDASGRIYLYVH